MPTFENAASVNTSVDSAGGALAGFNLDCGTNSGRFAFVSVNWHNGGGHTIDGVTLGGNAMTALGVKIDNGDTRSLRGFIYEGPATGLQEIIVTFSSGSLDNRGVAVCAVAYSDAAQSSSTSGYATNFSDTGTDADITVSSASGETVIAAAASRGSGWTTDDVGGTERVEDAALIAAGASGCISDRDGSASVTAQHTSPNAAWAALGFSLAPAAAGGPTGPVAQVITTGT